MQRSSLVVFVFSAIGLAACGDETDSSSPAGAAGNNTAGSSNGGSDAGGSGGTGGSSQAGSGGGDQAGAAGSSQAGAGGSGVAGQNSSGTGGTAGSGAAGQGGSGSGEDLCKGICEHDTQLSSELQCKDGACAAQCPQIIALVEQKGCTGIYKTLLDCSFQQPSSSFACDPDNGGVDLKEEFCKPEAEAITKCLGF